MPAISAEIFKKNFTTVPEALSLPIFSLCSDISPNHTATWVQVRPDENAVENECFNNVLAKVAQEGGDIVYGWTIWEWPRVFIEAEHHAVWEKDCTLLDITPHINGETKILFLPDPLRVFDFKGMKRQINVKRSLCQFASVDDWIKAANSLQWALEEHSIGDEIRIDRAQLASLVGNLRSAQCALLVELAANTKVNDRCFCNSGKKFKKCCSLLIDLRDDPGRRRSPTNL